MEHTFHLRFLASNRTIYEGPCLSVILPMEDGQYGILAHHRDVVVALVPGVFKAQFPGEETHRVLAVSGGMAKMEDNELLILVATAERPEEISERKAKEALAQAKEDMLQKKSLMEYRGARYKMQRELSRLSVKSYKEL